MSSDWPIKPLQLVAREVTVGYVGAMASEYVESGVPFLRSLNIEPFGVNTNDLKFITPDFHNRIRKSILRPGDVAIVRTGKPGICAVIPDWLEEANCSDLVVVRCGEEIRPHFLCYWVNSIASHHISSHTVGAVQQHFNVGAAKTMNVAVPSLKDQDKVLEVLRGLDDRITLLRETNATLEAIAQALFKSWFVDFDPVRAKMAGRAPEGMDEATAALFPDALEETELGLVPKGWRVAKFEDFVLRISVGKKFDQKSAKSQGRIPILDQGKSGVIGYHDEDPGVRVSLEEPVVVFANHTCYMRLISYDFSAIQNVLPFRGKGIDTVWAYYATKGRVKFSEYKGHWPDFAIEKAVVPNESLGDAFRSVVDPLMRRVRENELQVELLSDLRDTLLPRLISGQCRVPEAQNEIMAAIE